MIGLSDGTVGAGASYGVGDLGVAFCLAVRNLQQLFPALLLKFGSAEIERHSEFASLAREIFIELPMNVDRCCGGFTPLNSLCDELVREFASK